ncbi:MAG TPA: hypothetical protein VM537_19840, partial [Anaerolineae bacterium]|nr:hypothetical protein [Anaerolineae bacterium]
RAIVERHMPEDKEDADLIIEQFRTPKQSPGDIQRAVSRARRAMGPAPERLEESIRDRRAPRRKRNFNGLGVGLDSMLELMPQ